MRFAWMLSALAALWVTPAQAAWLLGISVYATGTNTPYTPGLPPQIIPVEKALNFVVTLDPFTNNTDLSNRYPSQLDPTGLTDSGGVFFGLVTLANGSFSGSNFRYSGSYRNQFPGSPAYELSAPTFAVSFRGVTNPGEAGPVPEPTTWALMLVGFGAIGWTMRKSRQRLQFNCG